MSAPAEDSAPGVAASSVTSAAPYVGLAALLLFLCLVRRRRRRTHALRESKKEDAAVADIEAGGADDEEWEDFDTQEVAPVPEPEAEPEVDPFAELGAASAQLFLGVLLFSRFARAGMAPSLKKTKTQRHAAHNPVWGGNTTTTSSSLAMDDDVRSRARC